MSHVLINAKILNNNAAQKSVIEEYILDSIKYINYELKSANSDGRYFIVVNLPVCFDVPNMTNANAQLFIWTGIIDLLEQKGYRVGINYNKDYCRLKITWRDKIDELDMENRKKTLERINNDF